MALHIVGEDKLKEAQRLLSEVFIKDNFGKLQSIKYINFETLTPRQAENKQTFEHHRKIGTKSYPTMDLYTLKLVIIQDEIVKGEK